jgi:hypothetical protein
VVFVVGVRCPLGPATLLKHTTLVKADTHPIRRVADTPGSGLPAIWAGALKSTLRDSIGCGSWGGARFGFPAPHPGHCVVSLPEGNSASGEMAVTRGHNFPEVCTPDTLAAVLME